MGVVDPTTVGEEGVPVGPERRLGMPARSLGRGVQGRGAGPFTGEREVADADPQREAGDPRPGAGAPRTGEVEVDDGGWSIAADMVVRTNLRDRGAAERLGAGVGRDGAQARSSSASKIRFAPGISSGVGAA